jgi:hypothetical protein
VEVAEIGGVDYEMQSERIVYDLANLRPGSVIVEKRGEMIGRRALLSHQRDAAR